MRTGTRLDLAHICVHRIIILTLELYIGFAIHLKKTHASMYPTYPLIEPPPKARKDARFIRARGDCLSVMLLHDITAYFCLMEREEEEEVRARIVCFVEGWCGGCRVCSIR